MTCDVEMERRRELTENWMLLAIVIAVFLVAVLS